MQKLGRVALFFVGGLIIVVVALLLGLNLYVQSQGTQARIEEEVRDRLGASLNIQGISVTPWGGLKLSEISTPQTSGAGASNLFQARSLTLRVGLLSLFSKKLVIKQIAVADAKIEWMQDGDGKWRLPSRKPAGSYSEPNEVSSTPEISSVHPEEQAGPPDKSSQASVPPKSNQAKGLRFVTEIRRINLSHADFRFLDHSGNLVASFEDVGVRSNVRNGVELHGGARVAKVALRDRFFIENLRSPLDYDPGRLVLSKISGHTGGGDIIGTFSMQPATEDSPFDVDLKFRNVDADRVISDAAGPAGVVQGKLEGTLHAAGKTADPNALTGTGEISLSNGQVRQYSLLVALGQIFQIEELTQLQLEQAEAKFHITPGVVKIDELSLRSPNIHLSATGTVTFGGKLHLDSRLAINEKVRSQLFKPIRANFVPADEPGYSAVDFEVGGTVDRPKTNLFEKVVGRDLKDLVNSLWGGKTPRPKKKKQTEGEPEAEASPSSTSAPAAVPSATATPAGSP